MKLGGIKKLAGKITLGQNKMPVYASGNSAVIGCVVLRPAALRYAFLANFREARGGSNNRTLRSRLLMRYAMLFYRFFREARGGSNNLFITKHVVAATLVSWDAPSGCAPWAS